MTSQPDATGHFGPYGGRFVPEVLMAPLEELEQAYIAAKADPAFQAELDDLLTHFAGRPTPLYYAKRLTETLGRVLTNVQDKIFVPESADGKSKELRLLLNREPLKPKTEESK